MAMALMVFDANSALAQNTVDDSSPNSKERKAVQGIQVADVKDGDRIRVLQDESEACKSLVIEIQSQKGIGSTKLSKNNGRWPEKLSIRLHTKGLEQIQLMIGDRSRTYSGEFNSSRLQESWIEIYEEKTPAGETKTSSKPLQIGEKLLRVMDPSGKEVSPLKLPLEQGQYFHWSIPEGWLSAENPDWIEVKWVDYFRN
jgi:hypothetical protein